MATPKDLDLPAAGLQPVRQPPHIGSILKGYLGGKHIPGGFGGKGKIRYRHHPPQPRRRLYFQTFYVTVRLNRHHNASQDGWSHIVVVSLYGGGQIDYILQG